MAYRPNDLAPLLATGAAGAVLGYRQGKVLEWNQLNAVNKILVGGAIIENVPILNTNEAVLLQSGDIVGLLTYGSSWVILGRLTIPGTPAAASIMNMFGIQSANEGSSILVTSTTYAVAPDGLGPAVSAVIGPTRRCLVIVSGMMLGAANNTRPQGGMSVRITDSGGNEVVAPTDTRALIYNQPQISGQTYTHNASRVDEFGPSLIPAAGTYTFECYYQRAIADIYVQARALAVIPF